MAIMVGSARHDENGNIVGGSLGDQTGREVSTQAYYKHSKGWLLLRPKTVEVADKLAKAMLDACNNNNIGYDQNNRLAVLKCVRRYGSMAAIAEKTEADCSSLVRGCCIEVGFDPGNFNTEGEATALEGSGRFEKRVEVAADTVLYNGDVLVTKAKGHTVIVVGGNQRKEVYKMNTLRKGSAGNDVTIFEGIMKKMGHYSGKIDTSFGSGCVAACNAFQTKYPECGTNRKPDGSFGPKCWAKAFSLLQ